MMNVLDLTYQLGLWAQQHPDALLYGGGGFLSLMLGAGVWGRARRPRQTTHGSARWATRGEIRAAGLTAAQGVVLGRMGRQVLCDDSDTHVLLVAPSRSGKGIGPILCTLLGGWASSVLVFDPADGENADASAAWRATLGHRVEQFTPRRAPHTCINVLDLIRVGTLHEFDDAWTLADTLLARPGLMQEHDTARHFRQLSTMLLTATVLHLAYAEPPASLGKLWWLLNQRYATLGACLTAMQTTRHTSQGVHRAITELATGIANISSDKELSGVWTTAINPLMPYADPLTQRSTDTSSLMLDDLQYGAVPMSLYLVAPKTSVLDRLAPLYRVISEMVLHRLQSYKPRSACHRLLVIADEAPAYGYGKTLDKGAAETAKYGIKLLIVAQDIPQLEETFGRNNSVWGNTSTKVFYAPDSDLTAKRLSENFLGKETVEQPVLSKQQGFQARPSVAYQQVGRPLMTADELRAMHPQAAIVYRTGLRPILCGKVNCLTDSEYRGRHRAPVP